MCTTFSNLVFRLSRMLKKEDLEAISYLYKLPEDIASSTSATGLTYMKELERSDVFSSSNLEGLREMLKNIQRCDLLDMVEEYKLERERQSSTRQQPCTRPQEESIRLSTSYAQAKKTEEELAYFQKELIAFCSRHADSPDVRQFYTGMLRRLKEIKENLHLYTTLPLLEIIYNSYSLTPAKSGKQSQGGRQWQGYESQSRDQPGATAVVTDGPRSTSTGTILSSAGQRRQEHRIATQGQNSVSQPSQTTPPLSMLLRGVSLAATKTPLPQAHSTLNGPELHGADMDYDLLSPEEPSKTPQVQRDRSDAFRGFRGATSKSEETLTTLHFHSDPRPAKLSTTRKNGIIGHAQFTTGKQQNNRVRPSNSKSSLNSMPIKRMNSADDLLSQNKPSSCSPSRIPVLTISPKHQRHQFIQVQSSSRESSDLSGGSYSESDFTGSADSGVDVREFGRARFGRYYGSLSGSDLSPPLGRNHTEKEYAHLNKSTMEASSEYQKPQASSFISNH